MVPASLFYSSDQQSDQAPPTPWSPKMLLRMLLRGVWLHIRAAVLPFSCGQGLLM